MKYLEVKRAGYFSFLLHRFISSFALQHAVSGFFLIDPKKNPLLLFYNEETYLTQLFVDQSRFMLIRYRLGGDCFFHH